MHFCLRHFEAYFEDLVSIKTKEIKIFIPKNINTNYFKTKYQFSNENNSLINKLVNDKSDFYYTGSKQLIMNDFEELQICFNNKAYKAGIILAGSILEAFLIDWLSEIKKIDYFKESYIITDSRTKKAREATLSDYIQEIKILKKTTWEDAAQKSISIKKHRNQVHARLHLSKNDISKETCTQMIEYLKYVIKTRWEN